MKTIAIDQSSILISSLMSFIASDKIKSKDTPLSNPDDVAMFSDILISRVSNILCDITEPGDRVVLCIDKKDGESKYWRHRLSNRVASLYKINRDGSIFDTISVEGLNEARDRYFNWCLDNRIRKLSLEGFEADDIIAELITRTPQSIIISPDGDFNQLITSPSILRIDPIRWRAYRCNVDSSDWFGDHSFDGMWVDSILKTLGITDVTLVNANFSLLTKILMGDKSDCIPSVHTSTTSTGRTMGVGEKTAAKMILSVFSNIASVKHYNDLSTAEKTAMCNVLKNPDVNDVLRRMNENAEMIILRNSQLNEILNPITSLVDGLDTDSQDSLFKSVEGVSVSDASSVIIRTIETPKEFSDYVFD